MARTLALIGFGEAARAFAPGLSATLRGYDRKTGIAAARSEKLGEFATSGVIACESAAEALRGAEGVLSLVTADQTLAAARAADGLAACAFWFDMNSVAPATKRAAAVSVEAAGGHYIDVAVMATAHPLRTAAPLLVAGTHAEAGAESLRAIGFADVVVVSGTVGDAAAIKMIRSVMIKGIEALSAECVLAADAAGVRDTVIASLDASWPGADWRARFDYKLDRMMLHGVRRAFEMEKAVATIDALGTGSTMSRGTIARQRAIGALGLASPRRLAAKLAVLAA